MLSSTIEIVICTEKGPLERMAKILIRSIRALEGPYANLPIYSYQPRASKEVGKDTLAFFKEFKVIYINEPLNINYPDYPLANKPLACAHREKNSNSDIIVFIDTDSFFLKSPNSFDLPDSVDIAVRPVDLASNQVPTDLSMEAGDFYYWSELYKLLGVKRRKQVRTSIDRQAILEYYNSGLLIAKRKKGVYSQWLKNFEVVMSKGLQPDLGPFFIEQTVLSATIAQLDLRVQMLDYNYNFPVGYYSKKWKGLYPIFFKGKVHLHYHKLFTSPPHIVRFFFLKLKFLKKGREIAKAIDQILR